MAEKRLRKRALPKGYWAVVDRYDENGGTIGLEELHTRKTDAINAAHDDIRRLYTRNGRLSVVRVDIDASTEIEVTVPMKGTDT